MNSAEVPQQQAENKPSKAEVDEMKRGMLAQILSNEARERLSRIKIVKTEKAEAVEAMLLQMAQSGQIRAKITEDQLIDMLGKIPEQAAPKITVFGFYAV